MKERPIIFSGTMVRAILDGRKTQIRKVIKPQADNYRNDVLGQPQIYAVNEGSVDLTPIRCPYGQPGDRLALEVPVTTNPMIYSGTLEVTAVRVERLQEITEADAKAEGATWGYCDAIDATASSYRSGFVCLWDSIYAKRGFGWDSNPWVWVVEFKQVTERSGT